MSKKDNEYSLCEADQHYISVEKNKHIVNVNHLKEIKGSNFQFLTVPSVIPQLYPTRTEVLDTLSKLQGVSKDSGFLKPEFIPGNNIYFISVKYIEKLLFWIFEEEGSPTTINLIVDNSFMFSKPYSTQLKPDFNYKNGNDGKCFELFNEDCWVKLMEWFGGGISVRIKCLEKDVEPLVICLRIVCQNNNTEFKRIILNGDSKVKDLKKLVCALFGVEESKCRLHDFFKNIPYAPLDEDEDKPLRRKQLIQDNLVFIEVGDELGNFEITYRRN